ncbi:putative lectin [Synechococcus phage S-CBWM1]|uniref:Putative lectin n=1 Tax=Synechococcus phage S-CBWM1 TaxID=2053653 RepID=A0A3G1L3D6_9CAUD|nr:putative lectin [Synechococcus phage S-CBWM1]ATW62699.1 putative lectin [Synechococcus phage S-CBWM1]
MAAPNIAAASSIYLKTKIVRLSDNNVELTLLNNSANSGKVIKLNTLKINHTDSSTSYLDFLYFYDVSESSNGRTLWPGRTSTLTFAAYSEVTVLSRDNPLYLEEGDYITTQVPFNSIPSDFTITIVYEEIS